MQNKISPFKKYMTILIWLTIGSTSLFAQKMVETIDISDLYVRDPFIFADSVSNEYYLYKATMIEQKKGESRSGVEVYKSKNLKQWTGPYLVHTTPSDNWITGPIWAPEMHVYKGRYYLFATLNSDIIWKEQREEWPPYLFRGTQIFHADSPLGPFLPFSRKPHTPIDKMTLDGTLWLENDTPYMVYCHEWVEIVDGSINITKLAPDLSSSTGSPVRLFHASAADWSTGATHDNGQKSYVTDGCYLYKTKTGKLLMIWSSFKNSKYAIGIAESTTRSIMGPWKQQPNLLFEEHGGHGMIFKTFDGRLVLTFHSPNSPAGEERAVFYELEDTGDTLRLKDKI